MSIQRKFSLHIGEHQKQISSNSSTKFAEEAERKTQRNDLEAELDIKQTDNGSCKICKVLKEKRTISSLNQPLGLRTNMKTNKKKALQMQDQTLFRALDRELEKSRTFLIRMYSCLRTSCLIKSHKHIKPKP
jgi:hypothetical protein